MKLAKPKEEIVLDKRYLIPSIIAIGFIPLIMHEHTYNTHLENEEWFAVGNYTATDFFLFWKQWAVIVVAFVCLLLLLIRAKYYKEKLPWEKKAFIPLIIYCVFVFLSACFAKKPLFAWAGGYDMFQSAPAILSYVVLFYYTYSCIKSMDHILYLLRGAEIGITIELLTCFFQAIGHDLIATKVGKILVTNPSRWGNLDSLTLAKTMYGTVYNTDYLSVYLPVLIPLIASLIIVEKQRWRKIFNLVLFLLSLIVLAKGPSAALIAMVGAIVIFFIILCTRDKKLLVSGVILVVCLAFAVGNIVFGSTGYIRYRISDTWKHSTEIVPDDDEVPIRSIKTGNRKEGITVAFKNGENYRFTFSIADGKINNLTVWNGDGVLQKLTLVNEENQTYKLTDNIYFLRDDTRMTPCLLLQINGRNFPFVDSDITGDSGKTGYFLLSTAGRCVKLPQKNKGEVSEVFHNGLWSRRGPIYNRSIPLLKKDIFIGAGADNYIMVYPQRNYILDYYLNGGVNSLNVKPHSYYLQVWIQEGFIAFAAVIVFFFWYLFRGISKYRKVTLRNRSGIVGTAIIIGIIGYLIAVIANDSTICTAPVLWTVFGLGWGLEKLDDAEKMG